MTSAPRKQKPISSFFARVPVSKPVKVEAKVELTRSSSLLSTSLRRHNEFDELPSSDTSYDSIEVTNFSNPTLSRTFNNNSNTQFKAAANEVVDLSSSPERPERSVKKEVAKEEKPTLKRSNTGLFDLRGQPRKVPRLNSMPSNSVEETKSSNSLSEEQLKVIHAVVNDKKNVFFTGSAGTGKSVVLRELVKRLKAIYRDNVGLTASTGMAACNIGGSTLHRFLSIGLGTSGVNEMAKRINRNHYQLQKWRSLKVLIIDEISMIDGALFEKLNTLAKQLRGNDRPFGGIQLVCTGDFFQLPPIAPRGSGDPKFCFDSDAWKTVINKTIVLTKVFRQKGDLELIDMLNALRCGRIDREIELKFHKLSRKVHYHDGIEPTELYPTRWEVKQANMTRLNQLQSKQVIFDAIDNVDNQIDKKQLENLMCEEKLELKEGAQVMYLINLTPDIVNGSVGTVMFFTTSKLWSKINDVYGIPDVSDPQMLDELRLLGTRIGSTRDWLPEETTRYNRVPYERKAAFERLCLIASVQLTSDLYPVVNFKVRGYDNLVFVDRHEFSIDIGRPVGGSNESGGRKLVREQLPLLLAWAMSIHKAQGQTIDRLKVDLRKVFEKGQVYVAISRATNKDHLEIQNFHPDKVTVSPAVQEFYNTLGA